MNWAASVLVRMLEQAGRLTQLSAGRGIRAATLKRVAAAIEGNCGRLAS
jgi:hypothetical protein